MATYNGEKYIVEQIKSILSQIKESDELVISDDGSNDTTIEKVLSFHDQRIRIYHGHFHSPIYNFENAIKHAKGDVIFLSDQDDIWLPGRVDKLSNALVKYDVVVSNATFMNGDGKVQEQLYFEGMPSFSVIRTILSNNFFGASMAFKSSILKYALPFPRRLAMHDQWIGLMGCIYGKVGFVEEPLLLYRRHGNNASFCGVSHNPYRKRFMFRFHTVSNLILRICHIA
ncbi:glycosyltransferase family 2 protein [Segatella copri]|uniref:glycosyltransferase family 2 protein n=1 Tax=Segatella copri TaxID=165179 RepID=UPI003D014ADD